MLKTLPCVLVGKKFWKFSNCSCVEEKAEFVLREFGEILSVSLFLGAGCYGDFFPSEYKVLMNYFLGKGAEELGKW